MKGKPRVPPEVRDHWDQIKKTVEIMAAARRAEAPQEIRCDSVYTLAELAARIGAQRSTVNSWGHLKTDPLPVIAERGSTIKLIKGAAFIEWFERYVHKRNEQAAANM